MSFDAIRRHRCKRLIHPVIKVTGAALLFKLFARNRPSGGDVILKAGKRTGNDPSLCKHASLTYGAPCKIGVYGHEFFVRCNVEKLSTVFAPPRL